MAFRLAKRLGFEKRFFPTEVYPLAAIVCLALSGSAYYLRHGIQDPEVVWNRYGNQRPWENVKPDEQYKLHSTPADFWTKRANYKEGDNRRILHNL
ncbi:NADH dehydrogenase (ubiquinone) 1 alpha subcomplex subunit 4, partial [Tremellales sp. Uapishka_1]